MSVLNIEHPGATYDGDFAKEFTTSKDKFHAIISDSDIILSDCIAVSTNISVIICYHLDFVITFKIFRFCDYAVQDIVFAENFGIQRPYANYFQ